VGTRRVLKTRSIAYCSTCRVRWSVEVKPGFATIVGAPCTEESVYVAGGAIAVSGGAA
jgi:hypothetical protein